MFIRASILLALGAALCGCAHVGDSRQPIPRVSTAAPQPAAQRELVVVLPGFGDGEADLAKRGVAAAIHRAWPHADVLLTGATFDYYRDGVVTQRVHDEVIVPARGRGYARIWLMGASMGGIGSLLYEREHPGEVAGLLLFAPFLGDPELIAEIAAAGGPRQWQPGPLPQKADPQAYQRQMWAMVRDWQGKPELAQRVWVACGTEDSLLTADRLLAAELPAGHFIEVPGGHQWTVWNEAAQQLLRAAQP